MSKQTVECQWCGNTMLLNEQQPDPNERFTCYACSKYPFNFHHDIHE